jgi:hypothetical protein
MGLYCKISSACTSFTHSLTEYVNAGHEKIRGAGLIAYEQILQPVRNFSVTSVKKVERFIKNDEYNYIKHAAWAVTAASVVNLAAFFFCGNAILPVSIPITAFFVIIALQRSEAMKIREHKQEVFKMLEGEVSNILEPGKKEKDNETRSTLENKLKRRITKEFHHLADDLKEIMAVLKIANGEESENSINAKIQFPKMVEELRKKWDLPVGVASKKIMVSDVDHSEEE